MDPELRHHRHAGAIGGLTHVAGLDADGRRLMNATARKRSREQLLDNLRAEVLAEMGELDEDELQRQVEIKRRLHFHRLSLLAVKARKAAREIGGVA